MPRGPLNASQFVPTEFSSAEEKAAFGNTLLQFIESDWKQSLFTKKFYTRLSMTFGHIAHYNLQGFYETWFTHDADRLRFLRTTLRWPCHGDPRFTFCDVERELQREIASRGYLAAYELKASNALRDHELELLARLQAKYSNADSPSSAPVPAEPPENFSSVEQVVEPIQGSLF